MLLWLVIVSIITVYCLTEEWFMLLLLYCLALLVKLWQRSDSCSCCCYIVYHYCLRVDRGMVHVVVVILSTVTVCGLIEEWFMFWLVILSTIFVWHLTDEWFMLFLYCPPLLFKVWQRGGSCYCGCYIVYHYCVRFDRGMVHVLWLLYCLPLLFKVWLRSGSCCGSYIVYHYSLRLGRGEVYVVVVILSTIAVCGLIEEWFILWLLYCLPLVFKVWQRNGSCC